MTPEGGGARSKKRKINRKLRCSFFTRGQGADPQSKAIVGGVGVRTFRGCLVHATVLYRVQLQKGRIVQKVGCQPRSTPTVRLDRPQELVTRRVGLGGNGVGDPGTTLGRCQLSQRGSSNEWVCIVL